MFSYIFMDRTYPGVANLDLVPVDRAFTVSGRGVASSHVEVIPIPVRHGEIDILGFRIGGFAYLTDTSSIPDASMEMLSGVDVLVLDGLRHEPHTKHLTISEATVIANKIGARQTYLTHVAHSIMHADEDAKLPGGINLAYDGLTFSVPRQ
jgi:phosphoribosyl 1,2-cyclic phosphate phosphodiesterase